MLPSFIVKNYKKDREKKNVAGGFFWSGTVPKY